MATELSPMRWLLPTNLQGDLTQKNINRINKMIVFWAVAPCILIEIGRRFRGAASINRTKCKMSARSYIPNYVFACDLPITLMMEAVSTSKTSVNLYDNTQHTSQKTVIFIVTAVRI
jgi:hypothetical protein